MAFLQPSLLLSPRALQNNIQHSLSVWSFSSPKLLFSSLGAPSFYSVRRSNRAKPSSSLSSSPSFSAAASSSSSSSSAKPNKLGSLKKPVTVFDREKIWSSLADEKMTRLGLTPTSTTKAKTNAYAKATSSYKASKDHDHFKSDNKATKASKASKYNTLDFGEFEDAPQSSRRNLVRKDTRNTMSNRNSNRNSSRNSSSHGNGNSDRTKHRNNTYDNSRGYTKENTSDILMSNFKNPNVEQIRPRKKDNRDYQNNQDRQDTRNKKDKKNIKVVTNVVGAGYKKYAELKSLKESRPRLPKFAPVDFDADPDAEPVLPRAERRRLFAIQKREAEKKAAETDEQVKNGPPGKREMIIQAGPRESKRFGTERFFVMSKQDQENKELSKKNSKVELAKEDDESKKAKNQKKALVANDQFDDEIIDPVQDPENDVDFKDIKIAITATEKEPVKQAVPTEQEIKDIVSRVLYHDKHILVLNKPFGLKVQPTNTGEITLHSLLPYLRFGAEEDPKITHRLDKDTTGAIILARSVRAATILTRAFKAGSIRKSYIGVTLGVPQFPTGFISCPVEVLDQKTAPRYNKVAGNVILRRELNDADPVAFARMKGNAVSASTTYTVLDTLGSKLALVEFLPHTGRKHQIRVHSAGYLNTPLLGDYMYGPGVKPNIPSISNVTWESTQNDIKMHLHARSIIIPYGNKGKPLVIFAPLPPHFLSTFSKVNFSETKIHDHERGGDTSKVPRVVLSSTGELTATDDSLIKKRKNAEKKQKDKLATMYKKKPSANKENPETIKKKGALAPRAERQQARKARQVKALTKVVDSAAAASVKNPKDTRLLRKVEKAIKKVKDVEADHKKKEKARAKKKYQIKI